MLNGLTGGAVWKRTIGDLNGDFTPEVAIGNQNPSNDSHLPQVVHVLDASDVPAAPDFTLAADPDLRQICAGDSAEYIVTVGSVSSFPNSVTLGATGNPAGSTTAFDPNPVMPTGTSQFTIGDTGGALGGSYSVTISGTASGSPGHADDVTLDVVVPATPPTLSSPPNGALNKPSRPTIQWSAVRGTENYGLEADDDPALGSPLPFDDGFESGDTSAWSATVP